MNEENANVRKKLLDDRDKRHSTVIKNMIEELNQKEPCPFSLVMPHTAKYKGIKHAIVVTHKCQLSRGHEGKCTCCGITWVGWSK